MFSAPIESGDRIRSPKNVTDPAAAPGFLKRRAGSFGVI
jgi:hypothetical protein